MASFSTLRRRSCVCMWGEVGGGGFKKLNTHFKIVNLTMSFYFGILLATLRTFQERLSLR